jgi:hypothetical protein
LFYVFQKVTLDQGMEGVRIWLRESNASMSVCHCLLGPYPAIFRLDKDYMRVLWMWFRVIVSLYNSEISHLLSWIEIEFRYTCYILPLSHGFRSQSNLLNPNNNHHYWHLLFTSFIYIVSHNSDKNLLK